MNIKTSYRTISKAVTKYQYKNPKAFKTEAAIALTSAKLGLICNFAQDAGDAVFLAAALESLEAMVVTAVRTSKTFMRAGIWEKNLIQNIGKYKGDAKAQRLKRINEIIAKKLAKQPNPTKFNPLNLVDFFTGLFTPSTKKHINKKI